MALLSGQDPCCRVQSGSGPRFLFPRFEGGYSVHKTTMKLWACCAAIASAVIYVGMTAVPVMSMSGCGNNDAVIHCNPWPNPDAGAHDGGEGGAGGSGGSEPSDCP